MRQVEDMTLRVSTTDFPTNSGAFLSESGVAFRVWAPHATAVSVIGDFNNWDAEQDAMNRGENGVWTLEVPKAKAGEGYKFSIQNGEKRFDRIDPLARQVTNSVGHGIITDCTFDWGEDDFQIAPLNELVIYEMHIGTFNQKHKRRKDSPATFDQAIERLLHLKRIGINCVEVMPVSEFAGDFSWGYNPAHLFAVESSYGGPDGFRQFIKAAHEHGIAVILDVVYNHLGPSDLSVWQFDGWSENDMGGIYFYNDWKSETPWGNTRPDYGRGEVRQYLYDNAFMWLDEYHVDGLRYDMTLYIRSVRGDGDPGGELADGWSLAQWINQAIHDKYPGRITIAEDLQNDAQITASTDQGGAAFHTQWDAQFVHPIREVLTALNDDERSMDAVVAALTANYNGDPFQRVVYTESHDEVANGKSRMPSEINPDSPDDWFAIKRSTLGLVLIFTAPGVPMVFQGQEFLEDGWFRDTVPLDWDKNTEFHGIVRMFRDLAHLRLNRAGSSRGLAGRHVQIDYCDNNKKVLAFSRWYEEDASDRVAVLLNFSHESQTAIFQFPDHGLWKLRFNGDASIYNDNFLNTPATNVNVAQDSDRLIETTIGPYSALIYSRDIQC
ncbi:alpha-amylase family glycosyl hydrolase [Planctomicrobium sp. SH668]|uniref:alpha-amylase family glycosyl hydrolase n=1 Tax=Planctomicrobium sp. SH668 TaxID=3448126 RepID=UPI003F5C46FD